jgi:aerobic-type carbon monoxide dehydrogenase small subunit (CoxS/CutS family)
MSEGAAEVQVAIELDGERSAVSVRSDELLLETLRERFDRTSVRGMCGIGLCGTCTVELDGRAVSSCLTLTVQADERAVHTPEGAAPAKSDLDAVQQAFLEHSAYQCSYCIPGMVTTVRALLRSEPDADAERVREELGGNLCRCGTYQWVLDAVRALTGESRSG